MRLIDRGRDILPKDCNSDRERTCGGGECHEICSAGGKIGRKRRFAVLVPYNGLFIALFAVCAI
jgi:hypothetical protein